MKNPWKISTIVFAVLFVLTVGWSHVKTADAERQPFMKKALAALKVAKNNLDKATADKGGHRVKAIDLVGQAITEVEAGIAYDNAK